MYRKVWILVALIAVMSVSTYCIRQTPTPAATSSSTQNITATPMRTIEPGEMITYVNDAYHFSLLYPSDWAIQSENEREIILIPIQENSWAPANPADISQDPKIQLTLGEFAVAGVFKTYPEAITPEILRGRLEERVTEGTDQDFLEINIGAQAAFGITEHYDPGCYKAIYWRPDSLESIIKISTGCESSYLSVFELVVNSLRQSE